MPFISFSVEQQINDDVFAPITKVNGTVEKCARITLEFKFHYGYATPLVNFFLDDNTHVLSLKGSTLKVNLAQRNFLELIDKLCQNNLICQSLKSDIYQQSKVESMNTLLSYCRDTLRFSGIMPSSPYQGIPSSLTTLILYNDLMLLGIPQLIVFLALAKSDYDKNERGCFRMFFKMNALGNSFMPRITDKNTKQENTNPQNVRTPYIPVELWVHTLSFLQPNLNHKNVVEDLKKLEISPVSLG